MKALKTLLATSFLLLFGGLTQAQNDGSSKVDSNIPLVVSESFNLMYSEKDPVWFSRYQGAGNQKLVYIAKFIFDKRYCQAIYGINGNQIAFAATVEYNELPEAARKYMGQNYPTFSIAEALLVTDSDKEVTYELGIYIDGVYVIQVFSSDGTFLKNTKA
ncbi:MAG: hypothetical protein K2Y30_14855 [Flavobacteriaceae bacterium]|nr:hypothetical protein [Flavobacteriaceae bacterium]